MPKIVKDAVAEWKGNTYFVENGGEKVDPDFYTTTITELLDKAGVNGTEEAPIVPTASSHDLRHTFASTALAEGVPISEVSRWLGHKSIATTVDLYGHLVPEAGRRARDALDRAFTRR